eukprot:811650-Rhodomonas_salina.1
MHVWYRRRCRSGTRSWSERWRRSGSACDKSWRRKSTACATWKRSDAAWSRPSRSWTSASKSSTSRLRCACAHALRAESARSFLAIVRCNGSAASRAALRVKLVHVHVHEREKKQAKSCEPDGGLSEGQGKDKTLMEQEEVAEEERRRSDQHRAKALQFQVARAPSRPVRARAQHSIGCGIASQRASQRSTHRKRKAHAPY